MMHASTIFLLLLPFWSGCYQAQPPLPSSSRVQAQPHAPSLDLSQVERWVRHYVNETRTDHRLDTLNADDKLTRVAQHHSKDMAEYDYFDHVSLRGERPAQRAKQEGISCSLGENLYQTYQYDSYQNIYSAGHIDVRYVWKDERRLAADAVVAWLESPTHRVALLSPDYEVQGIGAALSPGLKIFVTQNLC